MGIFQMRIFNFMSQLLKLLSKLTKPRSLVLCQPPHLNHKGLVELRPLQKPQFPPYVEGSYLEHCPTKYTRWPHITNKALPQKPTDIKGVDHLVYSYREKARILRQMPLLVKNTFFRLWYFPYYHHLSRARKSNIAYTFSNRGGDPLNDGALYEAFKKYRGPYSRDKFFKTTPHPKDKAVDRVKYRRLVKQSLFQALHDIVPQNQLRVASVSGIWFFQFDASPCTEEDFVMVKKDILNAVRRVHSDPKLQKSLESQLKKHNKQCNYGDQLLKNARFENTPGAKNVPGYYPKLPFATNTSELV